MISKHQNTILYTVYASVNYVVTAGSIFQGVQVFRLDFKTDASYLSEVWSKRTVSQTNLDACLGLASIDGGNNLVGLYQYSILQLVSISGTNGAELFRFTLNIYQIPSFGTAI